jgi:hypothetical protein
MKATRLLALMTAGLIALGIATVPSDCIAQGGSPRSATPGTVIITLYHVATGKHLDFLRFVAEGDATAKEAGVPATQWFAHVDGDSWDYLAIAPVTTPEQDAKLDAAARKRGQPVGAANGIALRQFISSHTDTYSRGPMSAGDLLAAATQK